MDGFSLGSYLAIQPKHIILLGGTVFTVGLLKSALALLAVFCTPIVVRLCNEKNRQNVMAWCLLFSVFGNLLSSRTSSVLVYFISRLICVVSVPVQTVLKGTVAECFESIEESSKVLRRLGHIGTVGFIIGRVVGGHLADYDRGTEYVYTSMVASNLISIVLVKSLPDTRPKKPKKPKKAKERTRKDASILKEALIETSSVFKSVKETAAHPEYGNAFAAKVCVECASVMNLMAVGTTLAGEFKMSVANIGHVFVLNMAVAMAAARWLVPEEEGPARRTLSFSTWVQVAGLVALAWAARPSTFVAVTVVTAMAKPCVDAALQQSAQGQPRPLRRAFGRTVPFAHIVGPLTAGTASRVFGNRSGFLICALLTLLANQLIEPFGLPKVSQTK